MSTEQLVSQIKQATSYQQNKQILREKIQTDLHFAYNGGLFKSTPELILFASSWPRTEALYIEDTYQNPVHIPDPEMFATKCKECYYKAMNRWHQEHDELKRIRKV
jgi:adenylate cyclase class IV